ncbi:MAG: hypothetical protein ACO1QR_07470 [Chthoniobacteraceae bacterium]
MDHPQIKSPASPALGVALQAETAALRNDLDQATQLAAEYQRRLSSKNNDFAALKSTLEKAQYDLTAMQNTITELRNERHRYANEAMRAIALEKRLQKIAQERDLLRGELEMYRNRCVCDGAGLPQVTDISPANAERPAPSAAPRKKETPPAPQRVENADPSRGFIPMPFDDPEEPLDITFGS